MIDLNQRLAEIDDMLVCKVDRPLGELRGRLFFEPEGGSIFEVPIHKFIDQGISNINKRTGLEVSGHRLTVHVSGTFYRQNRGRKGRFYVSFVDGRDRLPCELENEKIQDGKTYGELMLRIVQRYETGKIL